MRVDECFRKRLLRRTKSDPLKVTKALEMAEVKKERAQDLFENGFFEESIVSSPACSMQLVLFYSMIALLKKVMLVLSHI